MTGVITAPPQAALDAARAAVTRLAGTSGIPRDGVFYLAAPHQVVPLTPEDVRRGLCWETKGSIWRFLVMDDSRAHSAVEVRERAGAADEYQFVSLNSGPFVESTVEAIHRAEAGGHDLGEIRLIRLPALYVEALWLHGDENRFVPLSPAPSDLDPYRIYPEREFTALLGHIAARRREGLPSPP